MPLHWGRHRVMTRGGRERRSVNVPERRCCRTLCVSSVSSLLFLVCFVHLLICMYILHISSFVLSSLLIYLCVSPLIVVPIQSQVQFEGGYLESWHHRDRNDRRNASLFSSPPHESCEYPPMAFYGTRGLPSRAMKKDSLASIILQT